MKEGKPMIAKEEMGLDNDGNEIFISTTKIPVKDRHHNVIGLIGIGRDISRQKKNEQDLKTQSENLRETNVLLEERQEEIQQMAEEMNVQPAYLQGVNDQLEKLSLVASETENVVVIMDGNANFLWVNQGFENKYDQNFNAFIDEHGANLRENSSNSSIASFLNQINITKKPFTYNSKSINSRGEEVWYQTNISPFMKDQEISNLVLIDSDITELKKAEEQIKKQKTEIETRTLELQTLNTTKDRLFSIIAHDLKNPFHSIMGFTDLLQKRHKDISREKLSEFLDMINLSTNSAYQLLENLLEWARSQTEMIRIDPENILVKTVVNEIIELQQLHARNKGIKFVDSISEQASVIADKNMFNTVIRNITSNAIKYTNQGGSISFKSLIKKDSVSIEITDTGIGMPEEKIEALFQLDKVSSTAGTEGETGTGLGLIVCQDFMIKNNGTITVKSNPGRGTTFILTLPKGE